MPSSAALAGDRQIRPNPPAPDSNPADRLSGFDRVVRDHGGQWRHSLNRFVARYSLIPDSPILDPTVFPWCWPLAMRWRDLRAEAERALPATLPSIVDLAPDHEGINPDREWKTVFLLGYGHHVPAACARFPLIWDAVRAIPGLFSAIISVHRPGAHLLPHEGVTKGMVTYHLPLRVPRDSAHCRIEVDGIVHHWREGEPFLFDDTYEHETWNDTDEPRVNLMLHVKRPLHGAGRLVQRMFFWGIDRVEFVRDARRNVDAWARTLRQREPADW